MTNKIDGFVNCVKNEYSETTRGFSFPLPKSVFVDEELQDIIDLLDGLLDEHTEKKIGEKEYLRSERDIRYDFVIINISPNDSSCNKNVHDGLLGWLINRCSLESTFIFIHWDSNKKDEKIFNQLVERITTLTPPTLKGLYKITKYFSNYFIGLLPSVFFISKMVGFSYFNEKTYKKLYPCIISESKAETLMNSPEAKSIASGKMVVGLIKDHLIEQNNKGAYIDEDLTFCVIGVPFHFFNTNTKEYNIISQVSHQFDIGRVINFSHTNLNQSTFYWGAYDLLPKKLNAYLYFLLKYSTKEILNFFHINSISNNSLLSRKINGSQYSLYSITVGQYIPLQEGCCTYACYYIGNVDEQNIRIGQVANALYAQLSSFILRDARKRFEIASTKSAIGSIMSRNGSHNIGSHVLAALSHNVGTMPDDRILYKYIQQRMDYVATVTTDFPTWTQPTQFLGSMMKTFLSQRHLLDHITGSEDLHAWKFQNHHGKYEGEQHGCLRFHIRKWQDGGYGEFITYTSQDGEIPQIKSESTLTLKDDIALAIPGGIVGQHAFFTILENVVRNAAKHDWSSPPKTTECLKKLGNGKNGNLDVFIDFKDCPDSGNVEFTLWSRISDVGGDGSDELPEGKTIEYFFEHPDDLKKLPLNLKQEVELARPFIDNNGSLRRENWGLAEMKISAGYLQRKDIGEIGGLSSNKESDIIEPIIKPITIKEKIDENDVWHLGYKFNVLKPKDILFILKKLPDGFDKKRDKELKRYGIFVRKVDDIKEKEELTYSFVVLEEFTQEHIIKWLLPFRVLVFREPMVEMPYKKMVPELEKKDYADLIKAISNDNDVNHAVTTIREIICRRWCEYVVEECLPSEKKADGLTLVVDVNGNADRAAQGLVTDYDILKIVCEESFNATVDSFLKFVPAIDDTTRKFLIALKEKNQKTCDFNMSQCKSKQIENMFALQIYVWTQEDGWYEKGLRENDDRLRLKDAFDKIRNHLNSAYNLEQFLSELNPKKDEENPKEVPEIDADSFGLPPPKPEDTEDKRKLVQAEIEAKIEEKAQKGKPTDSIDIFIRYLIGVHNQTDVFLRKYEERIVSLPLEFSPDKGGNDADQSQDDKNKKAEKAGWTWTWGDKAKCGNFKFTVSFDANSSLCMPCIEYRRHYEIDKDTSRTVKPLYVEPISGTQSYLTQLMHLSKDDLFLCIKLVENALMRVLIVDERVSKFVREHRSEIGKTFRSMNIWVLDELSAQEEKADINDAKDKTASETLETSPQSETESSNPSDRDEETHKKTQSFKERFSQLYESYNGEKGGLLPIDHAIIVELKKKLTEYAKEKGEKIIAREKEAYEAFDKDFAAFERELIGYTQEDRPFDILVIHQGIIDKWMPEIAHDSVQMTLFFEFLKQMFPYVVVTTGRGTPANIPKSAHLLPFSTIETSLFKKYPEKLILVDAIMNLLPIGER